ncbi:hypothetical protein [Reichenbachiella sp. MALMAid0571]|uniref:hypothetical protein n=1 Tax=Reichenbachiella sp. MALMAid0571 TaxID=3143939 RepID=UPI0032DF7CBE
MASAILKARHSFSQTDLLSRELPDITRKQAFDIQLKMLDKELADNFPGGDVMVEAEIGFKIK